MVEGKLAKELLELAPTGVRQSVNDVWGIILGDKLSFYRHRNAMALSRKLHEEAEKLGGKLNPERIPDQFAFEWGEAATRRSDATVQQMFARLLAKASTDEGSTDERLIYSLREISAEDALLFKTLYRDIGFRSLMGDRGIEPSQVYRFTNGLGINIELALDNLLRVSLVRQLTGLVGKGGGYGREGEISTRRLIRPSALGLLLYDQIADDEDDPIRAVWKNRKAPLDPKFDH
jgi:hypothetical protein